MEAKFAQRRVELNTLFENPGVGSNIILGQARADTRARVADLHKVIGEATHLLRSSGHNELAKQIEGKLRGVYAKSRSKQARPFEALRTPGSRA